MKNQERVMKKLLLLSTLAIAVPVTGTIKGTAISYSVQINAQGQELELVFSGTVEPSDSMKGTVDFGGMGTGNWSGSRKK